jgi:hypothetical protein
MNIVKKMGKIIDIIVDIGGYLFVGTIAILLLGMIVGATQLIPQIIYVICLATIILAAWYVAIKPSLIYETVLG